MRRPGILRYVEHERNGRWPEVAARDGYRRAACRPPCSVATRGGAEDNAADHEWRRLAAAWRAVAAVWRLVPVLPDAGDRTAAAGHHLRSRRPWRPHARCDPGVPRHPDFAAARPLGPVHGA